MSKKALSSVNLILKRKKKDDGDEEDEDEAYTRWADQWIRTVVVELTDDEAFEAAIHNISSLSQIDVTFNFATSSSLEVDLRRNEDERASTVPNRSTFAMISGTAYERSLSLAYSKMDPG